MEKDSQAGHALIPDQEHRDLSLPAEMIRRGFELALNIEKKQGLQPQPARKE